MAMNEKYNLATIVSAVVGKHLAGFTIKEYHDLCGHQLANMAHMVGDEPRNISDDAGLLRYGLITQNPELYQVIRHASTKGDWSEYLATVRNDIGEFAKTDIGQNVIKLTDGGARIELQPFSNEINRALLDELRDIREKEACSRKTVSKPWDIEFPNVELEKRLNKEVYKGKRLAPKTEEVKILDFEGLEGARENQQRLCDIMNSNGVPFTLSKVDLVVEGETRPCLGICIIVIPNNNYTY